MGRDKAVVMIDGVPLWQRQLATLRALQPAELFISGRADGPYAGVGVEIVEDARPGLGPLAGIAAALARSRSPRLVVLAIDLPAMTAGYLAGLLRLETGAIPQQGTQFEPLAAVYPAAAHALAEGAIDGDDRSLQPFVRRLVAAGLAVPAPIGPEEAALFRNVNTPADL